MHEDITMRTLLVSISIAKTIAKALLRKSTVPVIVALSVLFSTNQLLADENSVRSQQVSDSIYLLHGKGGNIGVSIGKDGTFLIDDKFAPMSENIIAEIKKLGGSIPKFVLNTHWHADHTGGNENLSREGSIIVAHKNVRKRLSSDNFLKAFNNEVKAYPESALPLVTFTQDIHFHINDDKIEILHIANAHTDGDSVAFFKTDNVLHTGDIFFNGFYPFIDIDHGGSLKGMLDATDKLLTLVDDNTKIIPGHGPLANKKDLMAYREMLATAYLNLKAQKAMDKPLADVLKAKPLKDLDKQWGKGLFTSNKWIEIIYEGLD